MLVTLTGAFLNAGDHLIGARARALLAGEFDEEIVNVTRTEVTDETYELFNRARAVILCGGPAYRRKIFPEVYSIDLARIQPKVVPYGLGWKARLGVDPAKDRMTPEARAFVAEVHGRTPVSSARDFLTTDFLAHHGIDNVLMTGCPAWYDEGAFERDYGHIDEPRHVVLSVPAAMNPGVPKLLDWLGRRFRKARLTLAYHHGYRSPFSGSTVHRRRHRDLLLFALSARLRGWRPASLAGSLAKMEALYDSCDLHVGYRVHAHLLCLSRRQASILVSEDVRGVAQSLALGQPVLEVEDGRIDHVIAEVERHFETRGARISSAVEVMRERRPVMTDFLRTI